MSRFLSKTQAMNQVTASDDFRTTVDTNRLTKGIYIAPNSGVSYTVHNSVIDDDIAFYAGGEYVPVATDEAVTISGYAVVYFY